MILLFDPEPLDHTDRRVSKDRDQASEKEESKANNIASGKVTRTIKGGKEVVVEIPLLGKGYPAPVDLDVGVASKKAEPRSRRRR
jgi:hypothetical protein